MAELHARDPARLVARFRESVKAAEAYPPLTEAFRDGEPKALPSDIPIADIKSTPQFVGAIAQGERWEVVDRPGLGFRYLDRELSPLRSKSTEPSARADTRWLDLFLANSGDGTPIIGEVKIAGDSVAYAALVQALMYFVEMTTASQRSRTARLFGSSVARAPDPGPFGDLYLIAFKPPPRSTFRGDILAATKEVSAQLIQDEAVASRVRRIVYLEAAPTGEGLQFEARFAFGPGC